jgi:hypothetical protein
MDKLNQSSAAAAARPTAFEPAGKIKDPTVRASAVLKVPGPGSVSVDKDHIWAFVDSSYTAVNLTPARVECLGGVPWARNIGSFLSRRS